MWPTPNLSTDHQEVYNSVALFFDKKPDAARVNLMVQRASEFCSRHIYKYAPEDLRVTSWRVMHLWLAFSIKDFGTVKEKP